MATGFCLHDGLEGGMLSQAVLDKYGALQAILREMGSVVIGYSGGVDSTPLVKVAIDVLGS